MHSNINFIVGSNIQSERKRVGFSMEQLSELVLMPEISLAQIEKGAFQATVEELFNIKRALNIELKDIFRT